jgi:hypothetical protein
MISLYQNSHTNGFLLLLFISAAVLADANRISDLPPYRTPLSDMTVTVNGARAPKIKTPGEAAKTSPL